MRKVYLDNLPMKKEYKKKRVDWENSVGYKVKFIFDEIEDEFEIMGYRVDNKHPKLSIKYNNEIIELLTDSVKNCRIKNLIRLKEVNKDNLRRDFVYNIGDNVNDNLIIIDRRFVKDENGHFVKIYKYKCTNCGFDCGKHFLLKEQEERDEYLIKESKLLRHHGCACCQGNNIVVKGINDFNTINPDLIKYLVDKEDGYKFKKTSNKKVKCICPSCHYEKYTRVSSLNAEKFSCSKCGDGVSYPEKIMFNMLSQLNVDFIFQYSKKNNIWCDKYKYDFRFKYNREEVIVETHGLQHYEENRNFKMSLKEVVENDHKKKQKALNNKIKEDNYIVIDCRKSNIDFIKKSILNSKLNDIFDLSTIDWLTIDKKVQNRSLKR